VKVVVAVKSVAALDDEFELSDDDSAVDPDYLEWDLNEWDAFSLEAALALREAAGEGEVVALTVGDEEAEEALLGCLAKGADRGLRIWDAALAGVDALAVARVLAAAVEREAADLVLCGVQSSDAVNGATGIALAGFLDVPHVAVVKRLDYDAATATATVERELEGGLVEVLRVRTPALLTIQTGINQPRYATLRAIKLAEQQEIPVVAGPTEGEPAYRVRRMFIPPKGQGAQMLEGSASEIAAQIAGIVKERLK
jgi:electron transfer flavoprotein beta subunit